MKNLLYISFRIVLWLFLICFCPFANAKYTEKQLSLWSMKELMKPPQTTYVDQSARVHSLLYSGVEYKGKPTKVFAYYSNPDILNGTTSQRKYPGIVLVHGGGGKAFREWVEKWAAEGYAVIAMDLSGNDGTGNKLLHAGPDQADIYKFEEIDHGPVENVWNYHAVANVILAHSWLRSMPEIDTSHTFITGISWGGYLTCIAASLDERFKAAAPIYGCAYFDEMDTFGQHLNRLSEKGKSLWLKYFDPSVYLPLAKMPFLFMNGNKDKHFNVIPYYKTCRMIPENNRFVNITPNMKHGHYEGWLPHEIRSFFDHFVYGTGQPPRVSAPEINNRKISVKYDSPAPLYSAEFHYTNDTISSNEHRIWKVIKPEYDTEKNLVFCDIPPEGFVYAFFHVRDHRNLTGSGEFIRMPEAVDGSGQAQAEQRRLPRPTIVMYNKILNDKGVHPELMLKGDSIQYTKDGLRITEHRQTVRLNKYYALGERLIRYHLRFSNDSKILFHNDKGRFRAWLDVPRKQLLIDAPSLAGVDVDFLNPGHEYIVEIYNTYQEARFRIIDLFTGQSAEISATTDGSGGCGSGAVNEGFLVGRQHDYYCLTLEEGRELLVKQICVLAQKSVPTVLMYGDSITEPEGYFPKNDFPQAWTQLIIHQMQGRAMSSGRGGTTIVELLERIKNELPYLKAKYVMVTIGTNGKNTEENLSELIEYIIAQGSVPILNNIPCNESGTQVKENQLIEKVRRKYGIKGCKFDWATSVGYDGKEVDKSTMWFEDYDRAKIYHHPNVKGSLLMFIRTLIDVPEIYE